VNPIEKRRRRRVGQKIKSLDFVYAQNMKSDEKKNAEEMSKTTSRCL